MLRAQSKQTGVRPSHIQRPGIKPATHQMRGSIAWQLEEIAFVARLTKYDVPANLFACNITKLAHEFGTMSCRMVANGHGFDIWLSCQKAYCDKVPKYFHL